MMSLSELLAEWQNELIHLYDDREVAAMFRITLEDVCGFGKHEQLAKWNIEQDEKTLAVLNEVIERLKTGEPLQHIIGFTYFDDLKIIVSPSVLIPRPETEELIYEIVKRLPKDFSGKIIDWCTGSGCIALALKNHFPLATVKGFDISEDALETAKLNAEDLSLDVVFEWKDALSNDTEIADVIVSNPPYIPNQELSQMHKNVIDFEPSLALFVPDNQPQLFYQVITRKAVESLSPKGFLFFELHENYASGTKSLVENTGRFSSVEIIKDLQGKERMLVAEGIRYQD